MELMNEITSLEDQLSGGTMRELLEKLILMLGPFAPYLAEELWAEMGRKGPVFRQKWPAFDPDLAREDVIEVVVQVNGKVRSHIPVPTGTAKDELERLSLADTRVRHFIDGKQVVKTIVVPDKLVNIVVRRFSPPSAAVLWLRIWRPASRDIADKHSGSRQDRSTPSFPAAEGRLSCGGRP
jgi:leucyl-tRNA synthetase